MNDQIEKWTEFYDAEMIRRSNKLKSMRVRINEEKARLASLNELVSTHMEMFPSERQNKNIFYLLETVVFFLDT